MYRWFSMQTTSFVARCCQMGEEYTRRGPSHTVQTKPEPQSGTDGVATAAQPASRRGPQNAEILSSQHVRHLPVILAIDDVPAPGELAYLGEFGTLTEATLQIDDEDTINATAIRFGRREALALAVRLTELLGPMDTEEIDLRARLGPGRDPADD